MTDGIEYIGGGQMDRWVGLWNERIGLDDRNNWLWRHRIWSQTSWSTPEWRLRVQESGARGQKLNSFVPTQRGSGASGDYTRWRHCSWTNGIRHQSVWRAGIAEQTSEHSKVEIVECDSDWYQFIDSVRNMQSRSGVTRNGAELLQNGRELTTKVEEQPWPQLVRCASIDCRACGCVFQEDWIVVRNLGEE